MPTPFPGMDPFLERPGLWKQVHTELLVAIRQTLTPILRPRYTVAIEQRMFLELFEAEILIGEPDVLAILPYVAKSNGGGNPNTPGTVAVADSMLAPYIVELPMPDQIAERYLEVRDVESGQAITVIELLSPTNKIQDRVRDEHNRLRVLGSMTNFIEVDLLRAGRPMLLYGDIPRTHYRILVSRATDRPQAQVFLFNLPHAVPDVPIPLRPGESEPVLALNQLLHELYDRASYDLVVHYEQPPPPPLAREELAWVRQVPNQANSTRL